MGTIELINMRFTVFFVFLCLVILVVDAQKKPKGKKPPKGKGKPKPNEAGSGSETEVSTGSGQEPAGMCPEGQKPCKCEGEMRKGKGKKPSKSKPGKAKPEKPTGSGEEPSKPGKGKPSKPGKGEKPELCCCDSGEGPEGPGGFPEPRGFCVDDMRMAAICVSGSSIADKMGAAFTDCADTCGEMNMRSLGSLMRKGKGKKPSKGKGKPSKSCPSIDQIMMEAEEKYTCAICHAKSMGWIDDDMVADEAVIEADLLTLPTEIVDALNGTDYSECMAKIEDGAMGYSKCMGNFTDEEQATLGQVFNGVAHAECFDFSFMEGCTDYMDAMMDDMAGMTTETITG